MLASSHQAGTIGIGGALDGSPLWGLSVKVPFLLQEIFDQEKGFMVDDCIKLEAHVIADAPHGIK